MRGVLLGGQRQVEGGQRRGIAALEEGFRRAAAHAGIGTHQGERADGGLDDAAQPVVDPDAIEFGFRSAAGGLAGDGLGQGKLVAVGLADEHEIVGLADIELAGGQGLEDRRSALLARGGQRADRGLAVAEAAGGEGAHESRQIGGEGRGGDQPRGQHRGQRRQQHRKRTQEKHD